MRIQLGATDQQITATAGTLAASGASIASTIAQATGAIPLIGPFIGLATQVAIAIESMFKGCGDTCTQATTYANQAASELANLFNEYMALPIHYESAQAAYLSSFDSAWQWLTQACSNPQLQAAGQRCITDRQAGACAMHIAQPFGWKQNSDGSWTYVNAGGSDPNGSVCWNWFSGMRDPIASDPTVVPDPVAVQVTPANGLNPAVITPVPVGSAGSVSIASLLGGSSISSLSSSSMPLLIGGGLLLLFLLKRR